MATIEGRRALFVAPNDDGGVTEGLRAAGFQVERAARPAEARVQASRKPFTFVLCDSCFAEGDVQALLGPLRARGVRTIVVAPYSAEEDADLAARYGADEALRTPLKRPASQRMGGR